MSFKKFIFAAVCVLSARALDFPVAVEADITSTDVSAFQSAGGRRLADVTPTVSGDCVSLNRDQLAGSLVLKLADWINDELTLELIAGSFLPNGKYTWGQVQGCVADDGNGGFILQLDDTEKNVCAAKCYDISAIVNIAADYSVTLVSADVNDLACSEWI